MSFVSDLTSFLISNKKIFRLRRNSTIFRIFKIKKNLFRARGGHLSGFIAKKIPTRLRFIVRLPRASVCFNQQNLIELLSHVVCFHEIYFCICRFAHKRKR